MEYKEDGFEKLLYIGDSEYSRIVILLPFTRPNWEDFLNNEETLAPYFSHTFGKFSIGKLRKKIFGLRILDNGFVNYQTSLINQNKLFNFKGMKTFKPTNTIHIDTPNEQNNFLFGLQLGGKASRELIGESYGRKVSTTLASLSPSIIYIIITTILTLILTIWVIYISSKRNLHLESLVRKITGKKYFIRTLNIKEPNAFCFGGFGSSIFITKGLLDICTEGETIALCLHEAGHITTLDSIKSLTFELTSLGFVGYLIRNNIKKLVASNISSPAKIIISCFCILLFGLLTRETTGILVGKLHEYRADTAAAKYGYGKELIQALGKLENWVKNYKFKIYGNPSKFELAMTKLTGIIDVHPSTENRIKNLLTKVELYETIAKKDISSIRKFIEKIF